MVTKTAKKIRERLNNHRASPRWLFLLLGIAITLGYYLHYLSTEGQLQEVLVLRLSIAALCFVGFIMSFFPQLKKYTQFLLNLILLILTYYSFYLSTIHHFEHSYALGSVVIVTLVTVSAESQRFLVFYVASSLIATLLVATAWVEAPQIKPWIFIAAVIWVLATSYYITSNHLKLTQHLKEMTEALKESVAKTQMAAQAKSDFLACMSHEIRTPLNGILPVIQLLQESELTQEQRHYLRIVESSGELLLHVINDILDFSKIERGEIYLENLPMDLQEIVRYVYELNQVNAQNKGLKLQSLLPPGELKYWGDEIRLKQVLNNLVNNAIKFTPTGTVTINLAISTQENGIDLVTFTVQDSGVGVSVEQQEQIFEPFAQADTSVSRRFGGSGLGLAICRQLVQVMGGTIGVKSPIFNDPNLPGAEFFFTLPLKRVVTIPRGETKVNQSSKELLLTGTHILVVDDNEVNRLILAKILEKTGAQLDQADNGVVALELCNSKKYDLIFLDIEMPAMDGYEVARLLRKESQFNRTTPIVCITAHAFSGDREKALTAGMNYYLAKPFSSQQVRDLLSKILGNHRNVS